MKFNKHVALITILAVGFCLTAIGLGAWPGAVGLCLGIAIGCVMSQAAELQDRKI